MRATRLGPWILIACFPAWGLTPAFAFGEMFEGEVKARQRVGVVDSPSYVVLLTAFGTPSADTTIEGTHFLLDDGNFRAAGGPWLGITDHQGYIRAPFQEGRCYYATLDAYYPSAPVFIMISPTVCIPHSPGCGHCGPGTGTPCTLDTEEIQE